MIPLLFAASDRFATLLDDLRTLAWCAACAAYIRTRENMAEFGRAGKGSKLMRTALRAELQRISGMGRAQILGSRQYAMRVWLKPDRMRAYNVSTEEVMDRLISSHGCQRRAPSGCLHHPFWLCP